jgi:hypothetical protein
MDNPDEFLILSPSQLQSLPPHLTPEYIWKSFAARLSQEQRKALPKSIQIRNDPPAPSLRRTRSQDKK